MSHSKGKWLLIDTCGETAGVALAADDAIVGSQNLEAGSASAQLLGAARQLLAQSGWALKDISGIGVVNGPGSFTGMRTGLVAAKGLCEGASLPLVTVSRLAVLANAAAEQGLCALDAGRGELYVREAQLGGEAREFLCSAEDLSVLLSGRRVVLAETKVAERMGSLVSADQLVLCPLHAADCLPLVLQAAPAAPQMSALAEANYVREERHIYPKLGTARVSVE